MVPISFAPLLVIIINAIYFDGVKSGGGTENKSGSTPDDESGSGLTYEEIQAHVEQMQALSSERFRIIENQNNLIQEYVAQLRSIANTLRRQHNTQTVQSQTERQERIAEESMKQSLNQASQNHERMQEQIARRRLTSDEIIKQNRAQVQEQIARRRRTTDETMKQNRAQVQERIARRRRNTDDFMQRSRPQEMAQLPRKQRTADESMRRNRVRTQAPVESHQRIANEIPRKSHKKAVQANAAVQARIVGGRRKADEHRRSAESRNRPDEDVSRFRKEVTVTYDGKTKTMIVESVNPDGGSGRASAEATVKVSSTRGRHP